MIKNKRAYLVFIALLFLATLASATIEISGPLDKYNFGDKIYTTISINPSEVSGSFEINLVCEESSVNIYRIAPASSAFSAGYNQKINHIVDLSKEFIGNLTGDCSIVVSLGKEVVSSNHFLLSSEIDTKVTSDKYMYKPGETLSLKIEAKKANGNMLNGFVEISGDYTSNDVVSNGILIKNIELSSDKAPGKYQLFITAYDEKIGENFSNSGNTSIIYAVDQVPTSIGLSSLSENATPGTTYEFVAELLDQTNSPIDRELSLFLVSPNNKKTQIESTSSKNKEIEFPSNATPGEYTIVASYDSMIKDLSFNLDEKEIVDISIDDNTMSLVIKNIGNVEYKKNLNVTIGAKTIQVSPKLKVGESKKYNLRAPDGEYEIAVGSPENSLFTGNAVLTGNAISIEEGIGLEYLYSHPVIWLFPIVILLIFVVVLLLKYKTRNVDYRSKYNRINNASIKQSNDISNKKPQFLDLSIKSPTEAIQSLSVKGNKKECTIVSIAIKNSSSLSPESAKNLSNIINSVRENNGVVEKKLDEINIIFAPLITKSDRNELLAVKSAISIKNKLDEHNRKFSNKIKYNMGINSGEIISSIVNGKFNYTTTDGLLTLSRRIANMSEYKIILSEKVRGKILRETRTTRFGSETGRELYELLSLKNMESNEEKLRDLLKRTNM